MASQKSNAVAPKRARGHARVEALLEAASQVFEERGYDRATMTEIAARSSTAIGSLYRFFPTKEALGETLVRRYLERTGAALEAFAARAGETGKEDFANELVECLVGQRSDTLRGGVHAILDARGDGSEIRRASRLQRRKQVADVLLKANPALGRERARDCATVVFFLLKGERSLAQEEPASSRGWLKDLRRLAARHVAEALKEG